MNGEKTHIPVFHWCTSAIKTHSLQQGEFLKIYAVPLFSSVSSPTLILTDFDKDIQGTT